jgi:YD repeat-containing protein
VSPAAGCLAQLSASNSVTSLLWGGYLDSDHDGLDDRQEFLRGTNPMNPDTDGDGMSDGWEVAQGLNPLDPTDAARDSDGDGVPNVVEFQRGTDPGHPDSDNDGLTDYQELFIYHTDPNNAHTIDARLDDGAAVAAGLDPRYCGLLSTGDRYYYDPLDRLVGVDYTNGLSLAYAYDGNDNLVRQAYLSRDANTNGLPDAWELSRGLTNGMYADSDGDGYTDGQEWWAGTDPWNARRAPLDPLGPAGSNITAGIVFPFTPSNCVVAVGQLDGIGAEEIVVSADGSPGTNRNFLLILSQTAAGWTTQRVDVGSQGVTSLAIGRPANRDVPAIYVGLRGGLGSVVEVSSSGGQWVLNTVAPSFTDAAYVLGVRPGRDVLVSLSRINSPFTLPATPYCLTFAANVWKLTHLVAFLDTRSQRGLGLVSLPGLHGVPSHGVRLLDAGGLQVLGDEKFVPANAIWNSAYSRWFFQTTNQTTWEACQSYAQLFGGNLATVTDATLNTWLCDKFKSIGYFWIGLRRESLAPASGPWRWASGLPVTYLNWRSGQPNEGDECVALVLNDDRTWGDYNGTQNYPGVAETAAFVGPSLGTNEPPVFSRLPWRGHSLCAGDLRLTNALSIFYATVADTNRNYVLDAGDEFMLTEYLFTGTNLFTNCIQRIAFSGAALAPSYGLACVGVLYGNQQVLFTAEPDGRIFSWSATNATAPLTRQLFSRHHQGMAWHALAAARTLDPGQCLLGLRVDPATPNRCDVVLWPPVSQLSAPPDYPQTAPITQIMPAPNSATNLARVALCLWDGEADPARVTLQYQRPYETIWRPATIDLTGYLGTYPTGVTHIVTWNAALDLGPGFANTVQLRARAQDISLVGDWSGPVSYQVETVVGNNPRAYNDTAITVMNQPVDIDVLANDTVENGAPMIIYSVGPPAHGVAAISPNHKVRYTPAAGFVGTDQFIYTVTDGAAYSEATVTVTVTPADVWLLSPALNATNGYFSLLITGPPGAYRVLASTNLASWSDVGGVTNVTGVVSFTNVVPPGTRSGFYRAYLVQTAVGNNIVLGAPAFDAAARSFSMLVSGPPGAYRVQTSTNLTSWSDVGGVTNLTGTVPFTNQVPVNARARFYRAVLVP